MSPIIMMPGEIPEAFATYTGANNGTPTSLFNGEIGSSPVPNIHLAKLSNSRYVVTFDQSSGTLRTGSFLLDKSGTTLTAHSVANISLVESQLQPSAVFLDASRILYVWEENNTIVAQVWQISGNTIQSPGTKVTVKGSSSDSSGICLLSTDKVFCFYDAPGSNTVEGVVLTVSGTAITVNTPTATTTAALSDPSNGLRCIALSSTTAFIRHTAFSRPQGLVATVSGTTVTFGTDSELNDISNPGGAGAGASAIDATRLILSYNDNTAHDLYARIATVTGTAFALGAQFTVVNNPVLDLNFQSIGAVSDTKALVVYRDPQASNRPRSRILDFSGTTINSLIPIAGPVTLDLGPTDWINIESSDSGTAVVIWFNNTSNDLYGIVVAEG